MQDDVGSLPQVAIPAEWSSSIAEVANTPAVVRKSGASLTVAKSLRNREGYPLNTEYRFVFLDDKRVPLVQAADWRMLTMEPQVETVFQATSLGPAEGWRLEIRVGR